MVAAFLSGTMLVSSVARAEESSSQIVTQASAPRPHTYLAPSSSLPIATPIPLSLRSADARTLLQNEQVPSPFAPAPKQVGLIKTVVIVALIIVAAVVVGAVVIVSKA